MLSLKQIDIKLDECESFVLQNEMYIQNFYLNMILRIISTFNGEKKTRNDVLCHTHKALHARLTTKERGWEKKGA